MPGKFELYKDKSGKFRSRPETTGGQVVGTNQRCDTERTYENGVKSAAKNILGAKIEDLTV